MWHDEPSKTQRIVELADNRDADTSIDQLKQPDKYNNFVDLGESSEHGKGDNSGEPDSHESPSRSPSLSAFQQICLRKGSARRRARQIVL